MERLDFEETSWYQLLVVAVDGGVTSLTGTQTVDVVVGGKTPHCDSCAFVYYCVLLCIIVYYCVLLCIIVYCWVLLCIVGYYCVLLGIIVYYYRLLGIIMD